MTKDNNYKNNKKERRNHNDIDIWDVFSFYLASNANTKEDKVMMFHIINNKLHS